MSEQDKKPDEPIFIGGLWVGTDFQAEVYQREIDRLQSQLADKDAVIEGLRVALVEIDKTHDRPNSSVKLTAKTMQLIARKAAASLQPPTQEASDGV